MRMVLITREDLQDRALVHYRTKGSKNGERLYQNPDGSLTPLGRIHYGVGRARKAAGEELKGFAKVAASKDNIEKTAAKADIYKARSEREKEKAKYKTHLQKMDDVDKSIKKAAEFDERYNKLKEKEARLKEQEEARNRTNAEIKKDVEDKIKAFNEKTNAAKTERKEAAAAEKKARQEEIAEIRSLADAELDYRISRLQKERTYAELVNERANYEKSPIKAKAAKIVEQFAENFARKALNQAGDEVLQRLMSKARNGNKNSNGNNHSNSNSNNNNSNSGNNQNSNSRLPKNQKGQIKTMAHQGKSIAEIAKSIGLTEDQVKGYMSAAGITINKS